MLYTPILIASYLTSTKLGFTHIYTLANAPFAIDTSKGNTSENGSPENSIDKCFKLFLKRTHILKEMVPTVEKRLLRLVVPYLGTISRQTRTKLQKSTTCCKLKVIFKSQTKLCNDFHLLSEDRIP